MFSIANPVGLVATITSIPSYVPRDIGTPIEYHRLARLNLGNSLGYKEHLRLVTSPQVIYPIDPEYTLLSVNMLSPIVVAIDEIASSTTLIPKPDPWDRSPVAFVQRNVANTGGIASATLWTYTVPAGRMLVVAAAELTCARQTVATGAGTLSMALRRATIQVAEIFDIENVAGIKQRSEVAPGGLVLFPGEVLSADYANSNTGGNHLVTATATGYTFTV